MRPGLFCALAILVVDFGTAAAQYPTELPRTTAEPPRLAAEAPKPKPPAELPKAPVEVPKTSTVTLLPPPGSTPTPCTAARDCSQSHAWASADYLIWWTKKGPTPPLVPTGPVTDAFPGALDQPNTVVLFGQDGFDYGTHSGLRLSGGWTSADGHYGIEASGLLLERRSTGIFLSGDDNGQPFFGVPITNVLTNRANIIFVSQNLPDPNLTALMTGALKISSSSRLGGFDVNGLLAASRSDNLSVSLLGGFRWLTLREDFQLGSHIRGLAPGSGVFFLGSPVDPPGEELVQDSFSARNSFYGPQLGARMDWQSDRFSVGTTVKVAMGGTEQTVNIAGATTLLNGNQPVTTVPGGIFAQVTNIGSHSRSDLTVVPEVGVNVGYRVSERIRAQVGYTVLYWSRVSRPGSSIDTGINPNLAPGDFSFTGADRTGRPAFQSATTDFWAQGLSFGLEFVY